MLDWQGRVAECTGANVFFVKDGVIHTPLPDCFLDGITRRTVVDLAPPPGPRGDRAPDHADEMADFSECFITGSAAEVTPVSEIGPYTFQPGAISRQMMDDYTAEVRPKAKRPEGSRRGSTASRRAPRGPGVWFQETGTSASRDQPWDLPPPSRSEWGRG
jgi:hypothetical protein